MDWRFNGEEKVRRMAAVIERNLSPANCFTRLNSSNFVKNAQYSIKRTIYEEKLHVTYEIIPILTSVLYSLSLRPTKE